MRQVREHANEVGEYVEAEDTQRPALHRTDDTRGGFQGNNDFTIADSMTNGNIFDVDKGAEYTGHANGTFDRST